MISSTHLSNPSFELFLILHFDGSYEKYIQGHEEDFFRKLDGEKHGHAYSVLLELSGKNAKSNPEIGKLADQVLVAIEQEKKINQDIHMLKGRVSSNVGFVIESIINEKPEI